MIITDKELCCGCTACYSICPKKAISMKKDEEGFLYPVIDKNKCIDCGLCSEVCPIKKDDHFKEHDNPSVYVAKHKDTSTLMLSTSGGAFTAISDFILENHGIIYGADFDNNFNVFHNRAETKVERNRFRISKYVQSSLNETFLNIKNDLSSGKTVLFTGTPCQNAGLRGFISLSSPELAKNLYTCDVICYGIPSPLIWDEYKKSLERKYGGKIKDIKFRSKEYGWKRSSSNKIFLFSTSNNPEYKLDDTYYKLFFDCRTIMRPSCSKCSFTDTHRASDITIADYWGIEKYAPEFFDINGVSLILANSKKGQNLVKNISSDMFIEKRDIHECLEEQKRLSEAVDFPDNRSEFWKDLRFHGFDYVVEKYCK